MISVQNLLTKRFGYFTAVDDVLAHSALGCALAAFQAATVRLNEPPEPSPGLSVAMPWVRPHNANPRPEGVPEALGKFNRVGLIPKHSPSEQFPRPFWADDPFAFQSQGITPRRAALGCILPTFQAITLSYILATFSTLH